MQSKQLKLKNKALFLNSKPLSLFLGRKNTEKQQTHSSMEKFFKYSARFSLNRNTSKSQNAGAKIIIPKRSSADLDV